MPNHIHILLSIVKDDGRGNPSPTEKTSDSSHKYNTPVSPWKGEAGVFFGAHAAPRFVIPHKTCLYMQVYIHKKPRKFTVSTGKFSIPLTGREKRSIIMV